MRNHRIPLMIAILIAVLVNACSHPSPEPEPKTTPSETPLPTNTPNPTKTYESTETPTPKPTSTPEPTVTLTSTSLPAFEMGKVQEVPEGGFSFQPIEGYEISINGPFLGVSGQDGNIFISLYGIPDYEKIQTDDEFVDEFLIAVEKRGVGYFEKGDSHPIVVDQIEGTAYTLGGTMLDAPIEGVAFVVSPSQKGKFFGIGFANIEENQNNWKDEGSSSFTILLDTIKFIDYQELLGSACRISEDETYGYTEDNPIKVGGDWFNGPARERAYLDSLSGPNGEPITYSRQGSEGYENTILDIYIISYPGISSPLTLFVDEYSFEEPVAPMGFICWTSIPISGP
jgi:hypothetical protein